MLSIVLALPAAASPVRMVEDVLRLPSDAELKMPAWVNESVLCQDGLCEKPNMKYEKIADIQPGTQWMDAGGYCGSWASQRAFLSIGAWVSQQAVRDSTVNCGGHDEEILSCNIAEAWTNLKIDFDAFDYKNTPLPQTSAYFSWLKGHLAGGRVVAWMRAYYSGCQPAPLECLLLTGASSNPILAVMWNGQRYPIYNLKPPEGMYGHVHAHTSPQARLASKRWRVAAAAVPQPRCLI